METLDIIKKLCSEKGVTISKLENDLDYGNGSISKSKNMSADRVYQIAKYFNVSMEYLLTGSSIEEADNAVAILNRQKEILTQISETSQQINTLYKMIANYQDKLTELKNTYNELEKQIGNSIKKDDSTNKDSIESVVKPVTPKIVDGLPQVPPMIPFLSIQDGNEKK